MKKRCTIPTAYSRNPRKKTETQEDQEGVVISMDMTKKSGFDHEGENPSLKILYYISTAIIYQDKKFFKLKFN